MGQSHGHPYILWRTKSENKIGQGWGDFIEKNVFCGRQISSRLAGLGERSAPANDGSSTCDSQLKLALIKPCTLSLALSIQPSKAFTRWFGPLAAIQATAALGTPDSMIELHYFNFEAHSTVTCLDIGMGNHVKKCS
jgi:hypothetical protein